MFDGWELDPVMGFVILEGLCPLYEQMNAWWGKNQVCPEEMPVLAKFLVTMWDQIRHSEQAKEYCEKDCPV